MNRFNKKYFIINNKSLFEEMIIKSKYHKMRNFYKGCFEENCFVFRIVNPKMLKLYISSLTTFQSIHSYCRKRRITALIFIAFYHNSSSHFSLLCDQKIVYGIDDADQHFVAIVIFF